MSQCGGGAQAFLAVVGGMAALAGALRHAVEVSGVAIKRLSVRQRVSGFRRQITRVARAQSDYGQPSAHERCSQPGTNITAKYGASSSGFPVNGIIFASVMVPRST